MEGEGVPGVTLTARLKEQARELGFSLVGVASVEASGHMDLYREWVEHGRHGEMGYLAREDAVGRRAVDTADVDGELAVDEHPDVVVAGKRQGFAARALVLEQGREGAGEVVSTVQSDRS